MNWNCLSGYTPISRNNLHQMVEKSVIDRHNEVQKLIDAQNEFYSKSKGLNQHLKHIVFKAIAKKYGYREDWFIDKIKF